MKILYELSWLWETLGIALVAAAVCVACAALIGKAAKKNLSKKMLAVIGAAAFVGAILAVIMNAQTPMPLCYDGAFAGSVFVWEKNLLNKSGFWEENF